MHVVVWLNHVARVDPERLRVSSINKLAEAACDHLVTTVGWAPQEDRPVRELIAEWMKARG